MILRRTNRADEFNVDWLFARVTVQLSDPLENPFKPAGNSSQQKAPTTLLLYWFSLLPHLPAHFAHTQRRARAASGEK